MLPLSSFVLSLLTIPTAKRTKQTGGKTPDEAISPDCNDAPEEPDDDALDEDSAYKHTDSNSSHSSHAGTVSGSDVSVGFDDDPGEEFDEREPDACGELEWINCHNETENRTPILSLSESGSYGKTFNSLNVSLTEQSFSPVILSKTPQHLWLGLCTSHQGFS